MAQTSEVRALVFDVFGTCVDWRGAVIRDGQALARARGLTIDWPTFADQWRREGYIDAIARIRGGEAPYATSDVLFRRMLDDLLARHGVSGLTEREVADFAHTWRRLDPWPDVVEGLRGLKQRYIIGPLSNGTFATLTEMARYGGLPWDCILATELRHTYKPLREAYLMAPELLDLRPDQVMLVAAHASDLRHASLCGLLTAHVPRPLEWGPDGPAPEPSEPAFDHVAHDFLDLARQLGA